MTVRCKLCAGTATTEEEIVHDVAYHRAVEAVIAERDQDKELALDIMLFEMSNYDARGPKKG